MKVLLAHNYISVRGGAEVFYHEVGRTLAEAGHQVAYFSPLEEGNENEWKDYFPPEVRYDQDNLVRRVGRIGSMIYNRTAKEEFARLIRDFKPDLIHAFSIYVRLTPAILDAARKAKIPVVMSCNDYKHICPNYKLYQHGRSCEECKGGRFYRAAGKSLLP